LQVLWRKRRLRNIGCWNDMLLETCSFIKYFRYLCSMERQMCNIKAFVLVCCVATVAALASCGGGQQATTDFDDYSDVVDSGAYFCDICIDSLDVNYYTVRSGDNLSYIFAELGIASVGDSIIRAIDGLLDPRRLLAGNTYCTLTTRGEEPEIQYLIFARSMTDHVVIDLANPPIGAYLYRKDVTLRQRYLDGSVQSSLWNVIRDSGADPLLAVHIADVFAWQVDFFSVQPADSFQVIYTEAYIDDTVRVNVASIDGAVFIHGGREFLAVPFVQDSVREFFDADGQSLRRAFLKAPLDFFRITSRFTNARFHPVLKIYRAHHGVDYAAPVGTPVKSIGSGRVIARGYEAGGGGNYVKIRHNSVYTTSYMHLRGFASGVTAGASVQQGQVIGYVGSTGLSTGPHLDFRVYKNGQPINPLTMESPPSHPVHPELRDSFETVRNRLVDELREAGGGQRN